jgi:hypothetical protein
MEIAAVHPNLAGTILDQPLADPMNAIFNDPRAALVPAHLLVRDRYDSIAAASSLIVPALWFNAPSSVVQSNASAATSQPAASLAPTPQAYSLIPARKTIVSPETQNGSAQDPEIAAQRSAALTRWLDDLPVPPARP